MSEYHDNLNITNDRFLDKVTENPIVAELLHKLPELGIEQCYLTAGCLFQTIWNHRSGLSPETSIKDYDVFYFDERDVSREAEDRIIHMVDTHMPHLARCVEVRNQARVHLWYKNRFGTTYPQLRSAADGIDRYLVTCTCIGIDVKTKELYAPNGLEDMWNGVLRMNPVNPQVEHFRKKAEDYRSRWPWLTIVNE